MTLFGRGRVVERFAGREKIAVAKTVEIGATGGEERDVAVQCIQFVEVDREEENPIEKTVRPRHEAGVHHVAFVETGIHQGPECGPDCYAWRPGADASGRPSGHAPEIGPLRAPDDDDARMI